MSENGNVTNDEESAVIKRSTDQQNEISTKPEIIKDDELNVPTTTKLTQITRDGAPPTSSEITSNDNDQQQQHQPQQSAAVNYSQFSHPVYKKISAANGRINRMSKDELIDALKYLGLNPNGSSDVLQKRLKMYTKKQHLKESNVNKRDNSNKNTDTTITADTTRTTSLMATKKYTDFYIVIDFEATCEEPNPPGYFHEIIEFPAVLVDAQTLEIVSEFHHYCRPKVNPTLTEFCKQLTGITQIQVDSSSTFETVLKRFDKWLKEQVSPEQNFVIATDGPWDIDRFLKNQCRQLKLDIPHYFQRWVNIRKHFNNFYKIHQVNVDAMLANLGLTFVGRPHSGIDDSRNIARIMMELIRDGGEIVINETFR